MGIKDGSKLIKVSGHSGTWHQVSGAFDGLVNSFHNFSLESCPEGYQVTAVSEDGNIEAISHKVLRMEGWMWHPERFPARNDYFFKEIQRMFNGDDPIARDSSKRL